MLRGHSAFAFNIGENTSQWKRNGSTGTLPLLSDIRPLKGTAYLCSSLLEPTFRWVSGCFLSPIQGVLCREASEHVSGCCGLAEAAGGSQEHVTSGKITLGIFLPGTLLCLASWHHPCSANLRYLAVLTFSEGREHSKWVIL